MTKILIVDDDRHLIQQVRKLITAFGYASDFVTRAEYLLPKLEREQIDLILLDVNMPGIDGVAQLKQLKQHPENQAIPVIMLTVEVDEQLLAKCFEHGAIDFITKPVQELVFKARIQSALNTRAYIREIEEQKQDLEAQAIMLHQTNEKLQQEIIERKRAEELLKQAHNELEQRVQERTTELREANEQLSVEISERKRAEEQAKTSLKEKEVLLKEIHHRVKNNLQIISSLLDLQSDYIQDANTLHIFKDSQSRVKSMALIHEMLYQTQDLSLVNFAAYIDSLINYLFRSYGGRAANITLRKNIEAIMLNIEMAIPCGLIITELVSNAIKYAFPGGQPGDICIELRADPDRQVTLIVSDNGVGIPVELDIQQVDSLGLTLVTTLAKQIKGTIELQRASGTQFTMVFTSSAS